MDIWSEGGGQRSMSWGKVKGSMKRAGKDKHEQNGFCWVIYAKNLCLFKTGFISLQLNGKEERCKLALMLYKGAKYNGCSIKIWTHFNLTTPALWYTASLKKNLCRNFDIIPTKCFTLK